MTRNRLMFLNQKIIKLSSEEILLPGPPILQKNQKNGVKIFMEAPSNITVTRLLEAIVGELTQGPKEESLSERITRHLLKATPQLLKAIESICDINELKNKLISHQNDPFELVRLFTRTLMKAHESLEMEKNGPPQLLWALPVTSQCATELLLRKNSVEIQAHLPREILKTVLHHYIEIAPSWPALRDFAMVCIEFLKLAHDPDILCKFLRHGSVRKLGMGRNLAISKLPILQKIKDVSIDLTDDEDDEPIEPSSIPHLFACGSYRSFKINEVGNKKNFICFSRLRNLVTHSPNLEHLTLCGAKKVTNKSLFFLAAGCENLQSLKLSDCSKITEEALIALAACTNLGAVELSFAEEKRAGVNGMRNPQKGGNGANRDDLHFAPKNFNHWLSFLIKYKKDFRKLKLFDVPLSANLNREIVPIFPSALKTMVLISSFQLNANSIYALKQCNNLRHFEFLDMKSSLDDNVLINLSKEWNDLKSCVIRSASKLTYRGISTLLQSSKKLERLTLDSYKIDAKTIEEMLSETRALRELRFASSCAMVKLEMSTLIELLSKHQNKLPNLKILQMNAPGKAPISIDQIRKLAVSFPALEFIIHPSRLPREDEIEKLEVSYPDFYLDAL